MEYYVVAPDGSRYGPADLDVLRHWVTENRVTPEMMLEDAFTLQRIPALSLPGLFDAPPPVTHSSYQSAPQSAQYVNYPRTNPRDDRGGVWIAFSWIFSALGILCCPFVFSPIGIAFAYIGAANGSQHSKAPKIFGFASLALGVGLQFFLRAWPYLVSG